MMAKADANRIYQLKVTLARLHPSVWRRLPVPSSVSLEDLHDILQVAMGWTDSHFHQFEAKGLLYGKPTREFSLPMKDEARVRLDQVLLHEKDPMAYEYDFGDSWTHQIVLEKIVAPSPEAKAPRCIAGARACPPEDCGGVFGYAELLKVLRDPSHPEHEEMLEWIGEDYDPEFLDLDAINKYLVPRKGGL
jgi:Plasmid pRiA4b ORF-3-like protein